MAKRQAARRAKPAKSGRKAAKKVVKRTAVKKKAAKKPAARPKAKAKAKVKAKARKAPRPKKRTAAAAPVKVPLLDRARRTLADAEPHSTPSSLDLDQRGSSAKSGRAERDHNIREHHGMDDVTGGDPDVDIEDAYFAGEEAPGGDNPTPDQDIVEDIGKALGVTYNDNEELEGAEKLEKRDKHRWELDPASSDDFKERD